MKRMRLLLPLLALCLTFASFAPQDDPDAVVGTWLNGTKKGHVQIFKKGGTYFGKLIWLSEPNDPTTGKPKTDIKNADASKHSRPLLNLPLMYNFKYDGGNVWSDGKIYNPEDGKEYNCKMTLKDPNTLDVRGYVGISLLGKTQTWTRIK
ncbi:DUF2147 domain-containing protein [Spirosoma taeanense]|uniref:DUF2147 domain-containing protein n=1 Tax=Spirosoma taeanense TaxID=2735870 RepID=A0A6M5Y803_9BACT|nr:DUF2147 domain-containing protein [Spirosoma taeanense]QJW90467.1 DUF2147 domain-containing protein [Spirosoma taeanense]